MPESLKPLQQITVVEHTANRETQPSIREYQIESYEKIGSGMEGVIYRVQIKNSEGIIEPYALKVLTEPVYSPELKDKYELAKNAGVPVPDFFEVSNKGILMTDLSDNGQNLVLSFNDFKASRLNDLRYKQPELMATFAEQDISTLKPIVEKLARQASEANIDINHEDAWFFVMKPTGEMSIVLTDFLHLEKTNSDTYRSNYNALSSLLPPLTDAQRIDEEDDKPFWQR